MTETTIQVLSGAGEGTRILRVDGPLTLQSLFEFQDTLREHVPAATVIDLSGTPYMDSAALGAILGFHASCRRNGNRYALAGVNGRVHTLFEVCGVNQLLRSYATVAEAEESLGAGSARD